jgi:transposase
VITGGRYAPAFGVAVAVAKYADHLPLERQVRMMAREGLVVDSQTLWDQLKAMTRHLEPTYEALGHRALDAPVINVDETRWAIMGTAKPATGTVWGVHAPTVSYYRILPGKSVEEGVRYMLERWTGLTRFVENPRIPLDNNGRARTARPGRRPEKSLRLPLAARHAGRRPFLHAL